MDDKIPLYQRIAESVRQDVLRGALQPGDLLPPVRTMAERWGCTPGTAQQAYRLLAEQGLVVSRAGQGSRIGATPPDPMHEGSAMRRGLLVHQAEAFLLGALAAGHPPAEVESAFRTALDRWRVLEGEAPEEPPGLTLRFVGSHDPAVSMIAARFPDLVPGNALQISFAGSLGGLIALAEGKADLSGCHLWDEETDSYNAPFVQRLLPGRRVILLTLAHRRLGLLVGPGSRERIHGLDDLTQAVRFVNRQRGAGTRVWLDAQLRRRGIQPSRIQGYEREASTHTEVARIIAEGSADVGLGVEAVALVFGLGYVPMTLERYDLVIPDPIWTTKPMCALAEWLLSPEAREGIRSLGGYETDATGSVTILGDRPDPQS